MPHVKSSQNQPKLTVASSLALEEALLTIGEIASRCGVTVRTLRYYEEMDLIGPVKRSAGKYRLYNERALKRIGAIQALQDLNFSLEEILKILGSYSDSQHYNKAERIESTRHALEQQKAVIVERIQRLQCLQEDLDERITMLDSQCSPCHKMSPSENCQDCCQYRDVHLS